MIEEMYLANKLKGHTLKKKDCYDLTRIRTVVDWKGEKRVLKVYYTPKHAEEFLEIRIGSILIIDDPLKTLCEWLEEEY